MFRLHSLTAEPFASLFALSDEELSRLHVRRVVADRAFAYPCRVSLDDASIGDELLLLPYAHQDVASPYRASGPIYVRRDAQSCALEAGVIPDYVRRRVISLRGYDAAHLMVAADVCPGDEVEAAITRAFADPRVEYLHLHNAKAGCYSCRVTRA